MAANAIGPVMVGGFEEFVIQDESGEEYTLLFLPDRNNDELQAARQPPVFYYVPEQVRLARKGDTKDFKFRHIHFVGIADESSIGVEKGETQGGVLAFTTTSRYPTSVLKQAEKQILERFSGKNDKYWGLRTNVAPSIRIAPIAKNTTAVANIAPQADGSLPSEAAGTETPAAGGGAAAPAVPGGVPAGGVPAAGGDAGSAPGADAGPRGVITRGFNAMRPVPHGRDFRAPSSALNPWAWKMEGQGPGSVTGGENAFAALLGPMPSEILWAGAHGAYTPLVVTQNLVLPMWTQLMRVKITGSWSRIFTHFSSHVNARYMWASADIKAEFNQLRLKGDIKVVVDIDGTMPGGAELEKSINQRIDLIVQLFTEQAKKVIFDPAPPNLQPAEAPSGGLLGSLFGGSAGLAVKLRRDETYVDLSYDETRYFRYLQPHTISSSLQGFFNEIQNDPTAEKKYFQRLVLGGLGTKVRRFVKPVVNWPDKAARWAGQPVAFLSAQVGYPGQQGQIQWKPCTFQKSDPADTTFKPEFVELRKDEVTNPPANWEPDKTFVKRKVHLLEPPGATEFPFQQVVVERNVMELDAGPNGTLTNDNILEVRADQMGMLDLGPIALGASLGSNAEVVEVELRVKGRRTDGVDRINTSYRFRWTNADQDEGRFLMVFTGQPDFVAAYQYRVHVTVKGTIFTKGQAWSGPWVDGAGNGALMVDVPSPDAPGVTMRSLTAREMFVEGVVRAVEIPAAVGEPAVAPGEPGAPPLPAAPGVGAPGAQGAPGVPVAAEAGAPSAPGESRTARGIPEPPPPPPPPSRGRGVVPATADRTVSGYETTS
ncbi:MAG: hypothetical protein IPP91_00535 [Betaproteobacteria bacterium]|nr:hypothetical protein [Betaproteobacteria bacterium]